MLNIKARLAIRIVSDLLIIFIMALMYLAVPATGYHYSGFFLDDTSIRLPFRKQTISTGEVTAFGILLPILTILLLELCIALYHRFGKKGRSTWAEIGATSYDFVISFAVGFTLCCMLTVVIKYRLSALRPYFLEVCQPNYQSNSSGYVTLYTCKAPKSRELDNAFISFVSGHSAVAAVAVVFTVLYLQERLILPIAPLIRPLLQTVFACAGLYVGFTRITDHWHHPQDVAAGLLLGSAAAFASFFGYRPMLYSVITYDHSSRV